MTIQPIYMIPQNELGEENMLPNKTNYRLTRIQKIRFN